MMGGEITLTWHHAGPSWLKGARFLPESLTSDVSGVYLIHRKAPDGRDVIKIGEGQILARLRQHRRDPEINSERCVGSLSLTWAEVGSRMDRLQIERFLTDCYAPKFGSVHHLRGVEVNLPFRKTRKLGSTE